jgi:hypothetical protein
LAIVIFFGLHPRRTVVMEDTEAEPSKELLSEESPREATTKKVVTEIAEDGHEVIIEEYDPQDKNY